MFSKAAPAASYIAAFIYLIHGPLPSLGLRCWQGDGTHCFRGGNNHDWSSRGLHSVRGVALPNGLSSTLSAYVASVTDNDGVIALQASNVASPRRWLESHPPGAYTVLRADIFTSKNKNERSTRSYVWGRDFHLKRLVHSIQCFQLLSSSSETDYKASMDQRDTDGVVSSQTIEVTSKMIDSLIESVPSAAYELPPPVTTAMITILWHSNAGRNVHDINIVGHICLAPGALSTFRAPPSTLESYMPTWESVTVTVALPPPSLGPHPSRVAEGLNNSPLLPSRLDSFPTAKLSQWCHLRRPLELEFKEQPWDAFDIDVGEVLLSQTQDDHTALLEGLTSNFFIVEKVDPGKNRGPPAYILRTAGSGILKGYARSLVIDHAIQLGYEVDSVNPPLLTATSTQSWVECFLSSSVKLVTPVHRIMIPVYSWTNDGAPITSSFEEVWSRPSDRGEPGCPDESAVSKTILEAILRDTLPLHDGGVYQ
jgi:Amino-transferase class IV